MNFPDLLADTFRALWAHKTRTALTMFGIGWGVVSITLMVAAGEGLYAGQQNVSRQFAKDVMIVFSGRTSMHAGGKRAGRQMRWRADDHAVIAPECPACRHVLPELGEGAVPVRSRFNNASLRVTGSLPPFAEIRNIPVAEGRFYNTADVDQARRVAFLGSDVKKQLFGDRDALGRTVRIRSIPYTVIGVMESKEQDSSYDGQDVFKVFIPVSAMLRDFPKKSPAPPDQIDRFLVTPRSVAQHEECKRQFRRSVARLHGCDPRDEEAIPIWDTIENAKAFQTMIDGMKNFLGAVGVATLLLGGIGVMNVMLVAVRERTREIGVRKAVGASSRSIVRQFFVETALVVFFSGGLGLAVAHGLCAAVNSMQMPQYFAGLLPTWEPGLLACGLLGGVAILAGLYPAAQAASVDPIEALRHEPGS